MSNAAMELAPPRDPKQIARVRALLALRASIQSLKDALHQAEDGMDGTGAPKVASGER